MRRCLCLALGVGAALLLLLARLPPAPNPSRPAPAPPLTLASVSAHKLIGYTEEEATLQFSSNATNSPIHIVTSEDDNQKTERVVLTRDLYEAGHLWAHPELCPRLGADIELLILITSVPEDVTARAGIRLTWGHYAKRRDVVMAFILGRSSEQLMETLSAEDALYGDLIMGASWDSYANLTLKVLSMLEWAASYCPRAHRLLKADRDMFINVGLLLDFMWDPTRVNATNTIWGKVAKRRLPYRNPYNKNYLSKVQYPLDELPAYTSGGAYLLSMDAVPRLARAAPAQPYLRVEDAFVTGVLAQRLRLRRRHSALFHMQEVDLHLDPCIVHRLISFHWVTYDQQFELWRNLLDGRAKCTNSKYRPDLVHLKRSQSWRPQPGLLQSSTASTRKIRRTSAAIRIPSS